MGCVSCSNPWMKLLKTWLGWTKIGSLECPPPPSAKFTTEDSGIAGALVCVDPHHWCLLCVQLPWCAHKTEQYWLILTLEAYSNGSEGILCTKTSHRHETYGNIFLHWRMKSERFRCRSYGNKSHEAYLYRRGKPTTRAGTLRMSTYHLHFVRLRGIVEVFPNVRRH